MNTTRNDVKVLAQQIESLAKDVQSAIDNGTDLLGISNELSRSAQTFVFALGGVYELELLGANKKVVGRVVSGTRNYHNTRDNKGRFASKNV
jgi:hypothetical protein